MGITKKALFVGSHRSGDQNLDDSSGELPSSDATRHS